MPIRPLSPLTKIFIALFVMVAGLAAAGQLLHTVVAALHLSGLLPFLLYCLPFILILAYTARRPDESFGRACARMAFYGYSFILVLAGLSWLITVLADGP